MALFRIPLTLGALRHTSSKRVTSCGFRARFARPGRIRSSSVVLSYRFKEATELFDSYGLRLHTLTDFDTLLYMAMERELINRFDLDVILNWIENHRT